MLALEIGNNFKNRGKDIRVYILYLEFSRKVDMLWLIDCPHCNSDIHGKAEWQTCCNDKIFSPWYISLKRTTPGNRLNRL